MAQIKKNNKTITLSLNADLIATLDEYCAKELRTKSSTVELALRRFFDENNFVKEGDKWVKL